MIPPGSYELGPSNGKLVVKTTREGFAKKAGHDLIIDVTDWRGNLTVGEDPESASLSATMNVGAFSIREGIGGLKPLSDGDRADIKKTITQKILTMPEISFRSSNTQVSGNTATVSGDLTLMGRSQPIDVRFTDLGGGRVKGNATVVQSKWGIKPFVGMMGALKVADRVEVEVEVQVPQA